MNILVEKYISVRMRDGVGFAYRLVGVVSDPRGEVSAQ
jgi:hypothetical protein